MNLPDPAPELPGDLRRVREASEITGVSRCAIYRWFERGRIRFFGHPGCYYVSLRELLPPVTRAPDGLRQPKGAGKTGTTGGERR